MVEIETRRRVSVKRKCRSWICRDQKTKMENVCVCVHPLAVFYRACHYVSGVFLMKKNTIGHRREADNLENDAASC